MSGTSERVIRHGAFVVLMVCLMLGVLLAQPAQAASLVSVRDFGATGNGVTNDTAAIQAAMKSGTAPRVVTFPAGTYVFSNVNVFSDTSVVFEAAASGRAPAGATGADVFFAVVGTTTDRRHDVSLDGGTFDGRGVMGGAFVAQRADRLTVSDVDARDIGKNVAANLSSDITVTACSATRTNWGFAFEESEGILVDGCTSSYSKRDGILFYWRSRNVVASNNVVTEYMTVNGVGVGGIQVYGSTFATITGNTVTNGHYDSAGIRFRDSEVFWCEGNDVRSPGSSGLQVHRVGDFAGLTGGNGTFYRNTVRGAKLRGIDVPDPLLKPVRVVANDVLGTVGTGPTVEGMGIIVVPAGSSVVGNRVENATGPGIVLGGSRQVVAWNTVRNVAMAYGQRVGIFATGTDHAIVGNLAQDSLRHMVSGIYTYYGSSALLRDNIIIGATVSPYDIRGTRLSVIGQDRTGPSLSHGLEQEFDGLWRLSLTASDVSGVVAVAFAVEGAATRTVPGGTAAIAISPYATRVACSAIDRAGNVTRMNVGIPPSDVPQLAGSDRYATAALISASAFPTGSATVLVATGANYPDALAAGSLAGAWDAPVLLVPPSGDLPDAVADEIGRLGATQALVLGGTGAVSEGMAALVAAELTGTASVTRYGGADRYATARLVASAGRGKMIADGRTPPDAAFIVTGSGFADALVAAPLSFATGEPIVLVPPALDAATSAFVVGNGLHRLTVLGGTGAVSAGVASALDALPNVASVVRISAVDRYATSVAVAEYAARRGFTWDRLAVATGEQFPDALAGGPLQGRDRSVVVLTRSTALDPSVAAALAAHEAGITEVRFLGGSGAVSEEVRVAVYEALR